MICILILFTLEDLFDAFSQKFHALLGPFYAIFIEKSNLLINAISAILKPPALFVKRHFGLIEFDDKYAHQKRPIIIQKSVCSLAKDEIGTFEIDCSRLLWLICLKCHAKIDDNETGIVLVKAHYVFGFDVSMNDLFVMNVRNCEVQVQILLKSDFQRLFSEIFVLFARKIFVELLLFDVEGFCGVGTVSDLDNSLMAIEHFGNFILFHLRIKFDLVIEIHLLDDCVFIDIIDNAKLAFAEYFARRYRPIYLLASLLIEVSTDLA